MIFLKSDNSSSVHGFDFVDKSKFFGSLMSPICSGVKRCIVSLFQLTNLPKNRDIFKFANWQLFTANCYCSSSATASATAELLIFQQPNCRLPATNSHRQLQTLNCQLLLPLSITQLPLLLPLSNNPTHYSLFTAAHCHCYCHFPITQLTTHHRATSPVPHIPPCGYPLLPCRPGLQKGELLFPRHSRWWQISARPTRCRLLRQARHR